MSYSTGVMEPVARIARLACVGASLLVVAACAPAAPPAATTAPAKPAATQPAAQPTTAPAKPAATQPAAQPTAAPAKPAASFGKVKVGDTGRIFLWGPPYVGMTKGYYAADGIEYDEQIIQGAPAVIQSVLAGELPFGVGSLSGIIEANAKGQDLRAFAAVTNGFPNILVMRKDVVEKLGVTDSSPLQDRARALKGRTIALTVAGGPLDIVTRQLLESAGLNPDRDLTLTYAGNVGAVVAAAQSGAADGFFLGSPLPEQAMNDGWAVRYVDFIRGDVPSVKGMHFSVFFARKDYLDKNPDLALGMTRALWKSLQLLRTSKPEAKTAMQAFFKEMDPKIYDAAFETNYPGWPETPQLTQEGYKLTLDLLNVRKDQPKIDLPFDKAVTNEFVDKLKGEFR